MFGWLFKRKKLEKVDWDKFNHQYAFQHIVKVDEPISFPDLAEITFHSFNFDKAKDRIEALITINLPIRFFGHFFLLFLYSIVPYSFLVSFPFKERLSLQCKN